jgi:hypothetical protein
MNDQLHAPATLFPGKDSLCPLNPRSEMDVLGNRNLLFLPGFEPYFIWHVAYSLH